jgi:hypothetical protein
MFYTPDAWVVLKMGENSHKILAGWGGSFLYGDSWKLNSGIKKVVETEDAYEVHGYSKSVYRCMKDREHLNIITSGMLKLFQTQLPTIEPVEMKKVKVLYDS